MSVAPNPTTKQPKPRVVVAEADDKIRAATCEILRREAYDVTPCRDGADVLRLCKTLNPAILFVDVTLAEVDVTQTVRILQRCRETTPVRVVGICPPEFEEIRRSSLKTLGAFEMLQRPMKRKEIIAAAAGALASSLEQQAALDAATAKRPPRARLVEANSALLARRVLCPFHEEPVAFDRYTLRTGKVLTEPNFFDVPVYGAPVPGSQAVNFHTVSTIVCPTCLFATNHADYFQDAMDPASTPFPFSEAAQRAICNQAAKRIRAAGRLSESFFTPNRSATSALGAASLAIDCSRQLFETNANAFNLEPARIGNAHLRRAHLMELLDRPFEEIDAEHRAAFEALKAAFTVLRGGAIYRVAYQVLALALHFNDDRTAFQYMRLLIELDRDLALPTDERAALCRYLPRCQRAWEDREMHRCVARAVA